MIPSRTDPLHPLVKQMFDAKAVQQHISYDPLQFDQAFQTHMGYVFYYGEMLAAAEAQTALAAATLNNTEAQLIKAYRAAYAAKDIKPAENRLEKEVLLDPRMIDAQWRLRDAKYVQKSIDSICSALDHRRSMMLQHARANVAGGKSEPSLRS